MMYFALVYEEVVAGYAERRAPFREEHLGLLREAHARGELVMAGALDDPPNGALLIFKSASADVAEAFARRDPYVTNGVVTRWSVRPWNVVIGP